jgi:hypothetical protein
MLGFLVLISYLKFVSSLCRCAPLASCVKLSNGSMGCHCPFNGDGYTSCVEHRFVTKAVVRSDEDIKQWIQYVGGELKLSSQNYVLGGITQYVLELDSTNYDSMISLTEKINGKQWPYQVALLGSATSRIVSNLSIQETPPDLELLDVSYNNSFWNLQFAYNQGLIFVSAQVVPIPCIHVPQTCCVREFGKSPFHLGSLDFIKVENCELPHTNLSQNLININTKQNLLSQYMVDIDNTFIFRLHESEIGILATSNDSHAFFSVGLLYLNEVTQIAIQLNKNTNYSEITTGLFTRQVVSFILMQVEQIGSVVVLHVYAQVSMQYGNVYFVQYAWGDMNWILPVCDPIRECISFVSPCSGLVQEGILEFYVPIKNHSLQKGNITLYFVLKEESNLARVMTQCTPIIMTKHCESFMTVTDDIQIQILQGLTQTEIYRGFSKPFIQLNVEPQTDTLITLIARTLDGIIIKDLQAIHTRTQEERINLTSDNECVTCIYEQLILNNQVVSPRSCFYFGNGDEVAWIESYIGLVGSNLGLNIVNKLPFDVRAGLTAAVWINPTWPYPNVTKSEEVTFLHVVFDSIGTEIVQRRRLLSIDSSTSKSMTNSQTKITKSWFLIMVATMIVIMFHFFYILQHHHGVYPFFHHKTFH